MRTIASMIGKPENPELEAARLAFSQEIARLEQRPPPAPSPFVLRLEEWEAAERIVRAYFDAHAGLPTAPPEDS